MATIDQRVTSVEAAIRILTTIAERQDARLDRIDEVLAEMEMRRENVK